MLIYGRRPANNRALVTPWEMTPRFWFIWGLPTLILLVSSLWDLQANLYRVFQCWTGHLFAAGGSIFISALLPSIDRVRNHTVLPPPSPIHPEWTNPQVQFVGCGSDVVPSAWKSRSPGLREGGRGGVRGMWKGRVDIVLWSLDMRHLLMPMEIDKG